MKRLFILIALIGFTGTVNLKHAIAADLAPEQKIQYARKNIAALLSERTAGTLTGSIKLEECSGFQGFAEFVANWIKSGTASCNTAVFEVLGVDGKNYTGKMWIEVESEFRRSLYIKKERSGIPESDLKAELVESSINQKKYYIGLHSLSGQVPERISNEEFFSLKETSNSRVTDGGSREKSLNETVETKAAEKRVITPSDQSGEAR